MKIRSVFMLCALVLGGCSEVPQSGSSDNSESPQAVGAPSAPTAPAHPSGVVTEWKDNISSVEKNTLCSIDAVNSLLASNGAFAASAAQPMMMDGWLATPELTLPGDFIIVLTGDKSYAISASTGIARDDVSRAYSAPTLQTSGFHVEVAAGSIEPGDYQITLLQTTGDKRVACDSPNRVRVQ